MEKEFWKSKKFWASVVATLVPAANFAFGWGFAVPEVLAIVLPIVGYVFSQGLADFGKVAATYGVNRR